MLSWRDHQELLANLQSTEEDFRPRMGRQIPAESLLSSSHPLGDDLRAERGQLTISTYCVLPLSDTLSSQIAFPRSYAHFPSLTDEERITERSSGLLTIPQKVERGLSRSSSLESPPIPHVHSLVGCRNPGSQGCVSLSPLRDCELLSTELRGLFLSPIGHLPLLLCSAHRASQQKGHKARHILPMSLRPCPSL